MDIKRISKIKVATVLTAVLLIISVSTVFAFLISQDETVNKFTAGENVSHIEEKFGAYDNLQKGKSYEKNVAVKNDGSVDCYVRVFAETEDPEVRKNIAVDFNSKDWTEKQADGFYYYKKSISQGEKTVPLFTTLTANADINEFRMICYAETVQAYGFSDAITAFKSIR